MCWYSLSAPFGASLLMYIDSGAPQPRRGHMRIGCGKHSEVRADIVHGGDIQSIRPDHCSPRTKHAKVGTQHWTIQVWSRGSRSHSHR